MPLIDNIKDLAGKYLPEKRRPGIPMPLSTASGGIGNGIASYEDEMPLSKPAIVFYALQIFFSFLAMCCFASVASFQAKWKIDISALSGYAIFVSVTGLLLSAVMLLVPVIYDKYDKLRSMARAMREDRIHFILAASGLGWLLLASFITTISAFTQAGCKNASKDPHAGLGKQFQTELGGWCSTKRAGSIFFWFATIAWSATFFVVFKEWKEGRVRVRPRDPPFSIPVDHSQDVSDGSSYYPERPIGGGPRPLSHIHEDDEPQSPFTDQNQVRYGAVPNSSLPPVESAGRQSMDQYGAFSDPAPSGYLDPPEGMSRTMAYADPYSAIRANIGPRLGTPTNQPPPPRYGR